jgi:hypothetical protein
MDGNNEERKKVIDFSEPYFTTTNLVVTIKDRNIASAHDLKDKKVGAQIATVQEKGAKSLAEEYGYTVESRDRVPDLFQEIRSGHLDAIVIADVVANGYIEANEDLSSFELPEEHKLGLSIAFQKDSPLTGEFNRTLKELRDKGDWFAAQTFDVTPDIMALEKGIAAGLPLGATVASKELMDQWPLGAHGTTFGGNPIACSAGLASLEVMKEEKLLDNAKAMGNYAMERLLVMKQQHSVIRDKHPQTILIR